MNIHISLMLNQQSCYKISKLNIGFKVYVFQIILIFVNISRKNIHSLKPIDIVNFVFVNFYQKDLLGFPSFKVA